MSYRLNLPVAGYGLPQGNLRNSSLGQPEVKHIATVCFYDCSCACQGGGLFGTYFQIEDRRSAGDLLALFESSGFIGKGPVENVRANGNAGRVARSLRIGYSRTRYGNDTEPAINVGPGTWNRNGASRAD